MDISKKCIPLKYKTGNERLISQYSSQYNVGRGRYHSADGLIIGLFDVVQICTDIVIQPLFLCRLKAKEDDCFTWQNIEYGMWALYDIQDIKLYNIQIHPSLARKGIIASNYIGNYDYTNYENHYGSVSFMIYKVAGMPKNADLITYDIKNGDVIAYAVLQ